MDGLMSVIFLFIIFGPLVMFVRFCVQQSNKMPGQDRYIGGPDGREWKEVNSFFVRLPVSQVLPLISKGIVNFRFYGHPWQIVNIEEGDLNKIAANIPCLDEGDPSNPIRLDMGMIITLIDNVPSDPKTMIAIRFLPYEGPETTLQKIAEQTVERIKDIIAGKVDVNGQPIGEGNGLLESNEPVEKVEYLMPEVVKADQMYQSLTNYSPPQEQSTPPEYAAPSEYLAPVEYKAPAEYVAPVEYKAPAEYVAPVEYKAPLPVEVVAPPVVPEAPVVSTAPTFAPAQFVVPTFEHPTFEHPTFDPPSLTSPPLPVNSGTPAPSGSAHGEAALCPGCSQPINPSFPFCLYCGKNFN